MDVDRKIWIKEQVQEYVEQLAERGLVVDEEHKRAFLELLIRFYENGSNKEDWKEVIRFVMRHFVIRPLAKQIVETCIKRDILGKCDEKNA